MSGTQKVAGAVVFLLVASTALSTMPSAHAADVADATIDSSVGTPVGGTTDGATAAKEAESISIADHKLRDGAEKYEFQAEVSRLMDIIINSLYSNKDIFLRELISNASDALDKIRFLSLTNADVLGAGDSAQLDIRISLDAEKKMLTIRDKGIGMTKDELKNNLGTIAKSGTSAFLEQMQKGGDMNLIGQFGVGFYSVYLVADFVEVISKHTDDKQWIWESKADGNFAISEDTEGDPIGRGTQINIYLKEEAQEYADEQKLKDLVGTYSEFINFPIYLYTTKEVDEEVPVEEEGKEGEEVDDTSDGEEKSEGEEKEGEEAEVEDEEEEDDEAPKTKTIKKKVSDWELLNETKPIWLKSPTEVEDEEYEKFYKAISKDFEAPIGYTHFKAEGDVEFKAVLFIPPKAPTDLYDNYYSKKAGLKLYVRRVFISEEFDELVPKYLSFLKGIVDSDTLPLNVSRETLQQHSSLKTIKKKLVRKALDMLRKMAESDEEEEEEEEEGEETPAKTDGEHKKEEETKYEKFWKEYGKAIKLGIIEDASNRTRLAKLMRFYTSTSPDKLTSLEEYIDRMKEGQKSIYYLAGTSKEDVESSPFLEKLKAKGLEVIYFTDPIDEYTMQNLTEFDDHKFQNASKDDLKFGDKSDDEKEKEKKVKEAFKETTKWWKALLPADDVEGVKVSKRLESTPCIVVTSKYGWSANMERIMKAQALSDESRQSYMKGKKTLEINPRHPIIIAIKDKIEEDPESDNTKMMAKLLYETALLESGFNIEDTKTFAKDMFSVIRGNLGVSSDAALEDEADEEDEPDATDGSDEETKYEDKTHDQTKEKEEL